MPIKRSTPGVGKALRRELCQAGCQEGWPVVGGFLEEELCSQVRGDFSVAPQSRRWRREETLQQRGGLETAEQDQFKTGTVTLKRLARATDQRPASSEERPLRNASRALLEHPPQPWAKWVNQAHSLFTFHLPHP